MQTTCALNDEQKVLCWKNGIQSSQPYQDTSFVEIAAGKRHFCGLSTAKQMYCWSEAAGSEHVPPTQLGEVKSYSVGVSHTCAIASDNTVLCWGRNDSKQLEVPKDIGSVKSIFAGSKNTCALDFEGRFRCWGDTTTGVNDAPKLIP